MAAALCASTVVFASSQGARADVPSFWPSCLNAEQQECVESLRVGTGEAGSYVDEPGSPGGGSPAQPYVRAMTIDPGSNLPPGAVAIPLINFEIINPADMVFGPGVYGGLEDNTYTMRLRVGTFDPSMTAIAGNPSLVHVDSTGGGNFSVTITATPKPFISVMGESVATCAATSWSCAGEVGVRRNISGFVAQHPVASERGTVRGTWVATNASSFSTPTISITNKTITAQAAGPHTVPVGFPLDGLTVEGPNGLNPAFYKAFVPYSIVQAMLAKAPAELRTYLTPDVVKAKISVLGSQQDQPVSVVTNDDGVMVDLGLSHFSAPNPEIRFTAPTTTPTSGGSSGGTTGGTTPTTSKKIARGRKLTASAFVKVPAGYKVASISTSTPKVCTVSRTTVTTRAAGTCKVTVTVTKGKTRKTLKGSVSVA